jgi:hypothetical protein
MRLRIMAGCGLSLLLVDVVPITAQQRSLTSQRPLTCAQREQQIKSAEEEVTSLTVRAAGRKADCIAAASDRRAEPCSAYGAALGLQKEKELQLETLTKDPAWQACGSVLGQGRASRPGDSGVSNYRSSGQSGGSNTDSSGSGGGQGGTGTSGGTGSGQGGTGGSGSGGGGSGSGSVGRTSANTQIPSSGSVQNQPGSGTSGARIARTAGARTGARSGRTGGTGTGNARTGGGRTTRATGGTRTGGIRTGGRTFGSHGRVGSLNRSGGHSVRTHGGGRGFGHSGRGGRGDGHRR